MWNASPDDINNDSAQDKYWGDIAEECYNMSWEGLGDTIGYGDTEGQQIEKVAKALWRYSTAAQSNNKHLHTNTVPHVRKSYIHAEQLTHIYVHACLHTHTHTCTDARRVDARTHTHARTHTCNAYTYSQ